MREEEFLNWMAEKGTMTKRPMGDALSRCKRVERDLEVYLDEEFYTDGGKMLMEQLAYSMQDATEGRKLPGKLVFSGTPRNVRDSMSSLRSAVKKYMEFCEETGM